MNGPVAFLRGGDSLPAASSFAGEVDSVFTGLLIAAVMVIGVLGVLTIAILIHYRQGSRADRGPVRTATWKIETAWTVGTTAVFLFFFWRGAEVFFDMRRMPEGAEEIRVTGRQWMWDVRHPDGRREFNELHVRINQPVLLVMSSEDVIHSFFVPAFRLKQDLVPGKIVDAWFKPTRTGTYTLFCAQYCGTAHAQMTGRVIVLAPDEYLAWDQATGGPGGTARRPLASAARGREFFAQYGCAICHDGTDGRRAPSLAGIYGSVVHLEDGRALRAEDQFIHDAILHGPQNPISGYSLRMPDYEGLLAEDDVADLVSYVKGLKAPERSGVR